MEDTVRAFPEFRYIDTMSYQENYYRWKDMNDAEHKWYGEKCFSNEEAESVFRKQWGYKFLESKRGVHTHTVNYFKGSIN